MCIVYGMKHELEHFIIGDSYGGNQDWFRTRFMRIGGCGAETACDSSIYFARQFRMRNLYPFNCRALTREEYVDFAHRMEKYLWPRMTGIDKLKIFVEWYGKYLRDCGETRLSMAEFSGDESCEAAEAFVRRQIDAGMPIPTLILEHKDPAFRDYYWHWFLINGYDDGLSESASSEEGGAALDTAEPASEPSADASQDPGAVQPAPEQPAKGRFMVKAVTYSEYEWMPREGLWNTGSPRKGGFVEFRLV